MARSSTSGGRLSAASSPALAQAARRASRSRASSVCSAIPRVALAERAHERRHDEVRDRREEADAQLARAHRAPRGGPPRPPGPPGPGSARASRSSTSPTPVSVVPRAAARRTASRRAGAPASASAATATAGRCAARAAARVKLARLGDGDEASAAAAVRAHMPSVTGFACDAPRQPALPLRRVAPTRRRHDLPRTRVADHRQLLRLRPPARRGRARRTATASSPPRAARPTLDDLVATAPERVHAVALDVTDAGQIDAAVAAALDPLRPHRRARQQRRATARSARSRRSTSPSCAALMETMFFGPVALTQAVAAAHARARQRRDRPDELDGRPARDARVRRLLRREVRARGGSPRRSRPRSRRSGIRVLIVEPGAFRTGVRRRGGCSARATLDAYADDRRRRRARPSTRMDG